MARLALAAMLLMALAPGISRVLASTAAAENPLLQAVQMCTSSGLQARVIAWLPGRQAAGVGTDLQPVPQPSASGDACDYCSLVSPLLLLLFALCGALPLAAVAPLARGHGHARRSLRNLRGLGAQAPPLPF